MSGVIGRDSRISISRSSSWNTAQHFPTAFYARLVADSRVLWFVTLSSQVNPLRNELRHASVATADRSDVDVRNSQRGQSRRHPSELSPGKWCTSR
jgi:hypothetical protein